MRVLGFVASVLLAGAVNAQTFDLGDLQVAAPVAAASVGMAQAGAGYFTVKNTGDTADRLIAVEADFPRVMMHDTVMDGDTAKMVHLMGVDLAPGETVAFAPGGKHVMFMGLGDNPLIAGQEIPAVLVFEKAGRLDITFAVRDRADIGNQHGQ